MKQIHNFHEEKFRHLALQYATTAVKIMFGDQTKVTGSSTEDEFVISIGESFAIIFFAESDCMIATFIESQYRGHLDPPERVETEIGMFMHLEEALVGIAKYRNNLLIGEWKLHPSFESFMKGDDNV